MSTPKGHGPSATTPCPGIAEQTRRESAEQSEDEAWRECTRLGAAWDEVRALLRTSEARREAAERQLAEITTERTTARQIIEELLDNQANLDAWCVPKAIAFLGEKK